MALTYISSTQFSEGTDKTKTYTYGRRLQIDCGTDGMFYTHVVDSSFDGTDTSVTVNDPVITTNLASVKVGVVSSGAEGTIPLHSHTGDEEGGDIIENTLTSTNTDTALSAAQGKVLNDKQNNHEAATGSGVHGLVSILLPTITSPLDGAGWVITTPTIVATPYYSPFGTAQQAFRVQVSTVSDFSTTLVDQTLGAVSEYTITSNLPADTLVYIRCAYQNTDSVWSEWSLTTQVTTVPALDWGPGNDFDAMVAAGNYDSETDTGFMGYVSSPLLTDGATLASDIGLSAGTAFNTTTGWLKFYVGATADCNKDGVSKVLFIAKETLRYDLRWDDIYLAGAVYGTGGNGVASASTGTTATQDAQVTYSGSTFKVRLLTGSATDPAAENHTNQSCADDAGGGSEWNDLFYRVHTAVPTCTDATIGMEGGSETSRHGGPQDAANWANFTNTELQVFNTDAGDGTYCWCQEQGADTSRRVTRGYYGLAFFDTVAAVNSGAYCGWRPCLELVQA